MIRAIIADDEIFIRKSFRNRFHWENYGITIVGEAANGEEAYRLIPTLRPDLIFVDIRMPVLDGLDLASLIHDTYPEICVVLVTAYSEFEYARRGIACGVAGYLTKPLNEVELDETLQRILPGLQAMKQKERLLAAGDAGEAFLKDQTFVCAAVREDEETPIVTEKLFLPEVLVYRLAGEVFPLCRLYVLVGRREVLQDKNNLFCRSLLAGEQDDVSVGLSAVSEPGSTERLTMAAAEAVQALKCRIFAPSGGIFSFRQESSPASPYESSLIVQSQNAFRRQEYQAGGELLCAYLDTMVDLQVKSPLFLETVVSICLEQLLKVSWELRNTTEVRIHLNAFLQENFVLNFATAENLVEELKGAVRLLCQEMQERSASSLPERIVRYIQENYAENLSMETLKKEFFMSSSSLLLEFKKSRGMTISAYIEAVRMEKAKELLASGVCSVSDTAEAVGYLDANYFARAFKRHTGVTPSQYRVMSAR